MSELYSELYSSVVERCRNCILRKSCEICIFYLPKDSKNGIFCPHYIGSEVVNKYFSLYMSKLENNSNLIDKFDNEIFI